MSQHEETDNASFTDVEYDDDSIHEPFDDTDPNADQIGDDPGGWTYLVYPEASRVAINWSRRTGRQGAPSLEEQWGDPGAPVSRFDVPVRGRRANVGHTFKDGHWQPVRLQPAFVWPRKHANERDDSASTSSEAGFENAWSLPPPVAREPAGDDWFESAPPIKYEVDDNGATWETRLVMEGPYWATALPFWAHSTRRVASNAASVAPGDEEFLRIGPYQRIQNEREKPMSSEERVLAWLAPFPALPIDEFNLTAAAATAPTATPPSSAGGNDSRGTKRTRSSDPADCSGHKRHRSGSSRPVEDDRKSVEASP